MFSNLDFTKPSGVITALMYAFGAVALVVFWIKLLRGKREAEKGIGVMLTCVAACGAIVTVVSLFKDPIPTVAVIEYAVLTVLFLVTAVCEWICYRKSK